MAYSTTTKNRHYHLRGDQQRRRTMRSILDDSQSSSDQAQVLRDGAKALEALAGSAYDPDTKAGDTAIHMLMDQAARLHAEAEEYDDDADDYIEHAITCDAIWRTNLLEEEAA